MNCGSVQGPWEKTERLPPAVLEKRGHINRGGIVGIEQWQQTTVGCNCSWRNRFPRRRPRDEEEAGGEVAAVKRFWASPPGLPSLFSCELRQKLCLLAPSKRQASARNLRACGTQRLGSRARSRTSPTPAVQVRSPRRFSRGIHAPVDRTASLCDLEEAVHLTLCLQPAASGWKYIANAKSQVSTARLDT